VAQNDENCIIAIINMASYCLPCTWPTCWQ